MVRQKMRVPYIPFFQEHAQAGVGSESFVRLFLFIYFGVQLLTAVNYD